jgi:3-polyprenyl-4-hydroxybenzoate decarboxylase
VAFDDLRAWIEFLRRAGELVEVEAEVDPYFEVTEIVAPPVSTS